MLKGQWVASITEDLK